MNIDALSMLCASTLTYCDPSGVSSAVDKLTRTEFAALLSGLSDMYFDYALGKYCLDYSSGIKFVCGFSRYLVKKSDDWERLFVENDQIVTKMLICASAEIMSPRRCAKCEGRKFVGIKACPSCEGLGSVRFSGRYLAKQSGVTECQWRRQWSQRYKQLITYMQDIESTIHLHYAKATRSEASVYF